MSSAEGSAHLTDGSGSGNASGLQCRLAAAALTTWRSSAEQHVTNRRKLGIALARLRARHLASAFRAWSEWCGRRCQRRDRLLPALARLRNRELAAAHASWQEAALALKKKRVLASKVLLPLGGVCGSEPSWPAARCLSDTQSATAHLHCVYAIAGSALSQQRDAAPCAQWVAVTPCSARAQSGVSTSGCRKAAASAACHGA